MASDQSANLALPYLAAAQAQKHVTHNEALRRLDAHVQLTLESVSATAPPAVPAQGARWFVPAGATGAFAGQAGKLAAYEAGAFDFLPLPQDALAYIRDEARFARLDGAAWAPLSDGGSGQGQIVLESITATAPPASPADGSRWFVPGGASGAFAGRALTLATASGGAFRFEVVAAGTLAFIRDEWRLALFDGGMWVSPLAVRPTRSAIEAAVLEEDIVLSGATVDTGIAIPARAIVLGVSTRTLSAVTGAASYDCGIAGEASKFGGLLGVARGSSNSGVIGPTAFYAATRVRLTANGGVFTGGRVRVSIHILKCPVSAFPQLEPDWWTEPPYLLDGTRPALAADFVRERYSLNGGHFSSTDIIQRSGAAKDVKSASGARVQAPAGALAFDYESGRRRMVLEGTSTNLFVGSAAPSAAQSIAVSAQAYTLSFEGGGALVIGGAHTRTLAGTGAGNRVSATFTPAAGTLTLTPSGEVRKVQLETGSIASSYIATTSAAVTRVADVCPWSDAAAALLSTAGPCSLALRGTFDLVTGSKGVIAISGGGLLHITGGLNVGFYGDSSYLILGKAVLGGGWPIGVCIAWDGAGRVGAMNGAVPVTDATALTLGMDDVFFGTSSGMPPQTRFEVDELLIWPVKGGAPAVQSQARAWS